MQDLGHQRVLIVSRDSPRRTTLAAAVRHEGLEATASATAEEAKSLLGRDKFLAVLCEDTLPDGDFRSVIAQADETKQGTPVIVVSRRDEWESYLVALAAGASDYLAFPPYPGEVEQSLEKVQELSKSLAH